MYQNVWYLFKGLGLGLNYNLLVYYSINSYETEKEWRDKSVSNVVEFFFFQMILLNCKRL